MELDFFASFHVHPGSASSFEDAVREVVSKSRGEPGCLSIHVFQSTHDGNLFYLHSRWTSEEAFDLHAMFPHTVKFLERVQPLLDAPLETTRTKQIA